jgi:predicted transcriptional regulator
MAVHSALKMVATWVDRWAEKMAGMSAYSKAVMMVEQMASMMAVLKV